MRRIKTKVVINVYSLGNGLSLDMYRFFFLETTSQQVHKCQLGLGIINRYCVKLIVLAMIIYVIWNTTTFPFSEIIRVTLTLVIQKSSIIRVRNGDIPPREQDSRSRTRLCRVMTINLWLTRGGISSSLTSKYWMIIFLAFFFSYYIVIVQISDMMLKTWLSVYPSAYYI